jgi:predicted O-linked N-acetylglucosamine transferase (SPINDLY family)
MGLAGILEDAGRHDESLASFNRAIELRPDSADAHNNLGNLFFLKRRFQDALKSYDMALSIDKDLPYVQGQRLHMKLMCGNWENIGAELSALRNAVKQGKPCALPFAFLSLGDSFEDYARVVDAMVVEKNVKFKNLRIEPAPSSDGRIRLAYISADFREHPIAKSLASILELHDRSRFEVHGISIGPTDTSNDAERAIKGCDSFHDMYGKSEREIGQLVKDLGIDILLVTAVHTQYSNIELFAERYAPIQVNFLSAWSSGLEFFDYMTADPRCVDADERRYFSEKLVSIKGFISDEAQVVPDVKPGREDCGLPKDAFVFACFNDGYKITPDVFDAWVNILRRVEGSVLWLKDSPNSRDALRAEALKRNIDPTRLIFAPRVASISDHLARLHLADLTLDTLPYGGHTTMRDSLFAGVPFITQKGGTFVGRIGSSLLDDVDLTELIVTSAEQYENLAVDLAHNKARLDEIRARLRQTLSSRGLFNRQKYTAELDTALVAMYDRHKAGLPPDHIEEASITALRSA